MNIVSISKLVTSSHEGWNELEGIHPSLVKLFGVVVMPLSLLPPVMLYLMGSQHGDAFIQGWGAKPWGTIAVAFFLTELFTFFAMGWLVRQVAKMHGAAISRHDAYMLAGIAPIPLWLSSLALLVPNLAINAAVSLVALIASASLIYHGVYALCHMHEEVSAAAVTQAVVGAGLIAWAMLLLYIV